MRERLVSQRTGIINQIRAFLLERGVAVRQDKTYFKTASDTGSETLLYDGMVGDARAAPPNPFTLSALPPPTASHLKSPAAHARRTDPPPTERSCRRLQVDFMP